MIGRRKIVGVVVASGLVLALGSPAQGDGYRRPGRTYQVDVAADGSAPVAGLCGPTGCQINAPALSANGRFVAFATDADNLVAGDTNRLVDVFVKNLKTGAVTRASESSNGAQAVGFLPPEACEARAGELPDSAFVEISTEPSLSANGRYVSFTSHAPNLVPGDTNLKPDVFVHDLVKRTTKRVSVTKAGDQAEYMDPCVTVGSNQSTIDGSGSRVAFQSAAINLAEKDCSNPVAGCATSVYVRDMNKNTTVPVSVGLATGKAVRGENPSISGNGRYVEFESVISDMVAGDPIDIYTDVYVHDLQTGKIIKASVNSEGKHPTYFFGPCAGSRATSPGSGPSISADGRFIVFESYGVDLVPNDTNYTTPLTSCSSGDFFVHDTKTGRTSRVSVTSSGGQQGADDPLSGSILTASISPNGRYVAFGSSHENLAPESMSGPTTWVIYVHDRMSGSTELVSLSNDGEYPMTGASSAAAWYPSISGDGALVAFMSHAKNLGPSQDEGEHFYIRERGTSLGSLLGATEPVSLRGVSSFDSRGFAVSRDIVKDVPVAISRVGGDLISTSLAWRPQHDDLFFKAELDRLPSIAGRVVSSPVLYGFRFETGDTTYEVRAQQAVPGTDRIEFGLFRCDDVTLASCTKVSELRGGLGTTGAEVVVSVPLSAVGLEAGGDMESVGAFTALGHFRSGASRILDQMKL